MIYKFILFLYFISNSSLYPPKLSKPDGSETLRLMISFLTFLSVFYLMGKLPVFLWHPLPPFQFTEYTTLCEDSFMPTKMWFRFQSVFKHCHKTWILDVTLYFIIKFLSLSTLPLSAIFSRKKLDNLFKRHKMKIQSLFLEVQCIT